MRQINEASINNLVNLDEYKRQKEYELEKELERQFAERRRKEYKRSRKTVRKKRNRMVLSMLRWSLIALALGFIIIFVTKVNALGSNEENADNSYYRELEQRYEQVLKRELGMDGYTNCGITITSIITPGLNREYTVKIHHRRLSQMSEEEQNKYLQELSKITFPDSSCSVNYEILL